MDITQYIQTLAKDAKNAASIVAEASTKQKNAALNNIAQLLLDNQSDLIRANGQDLANATAKNLDAPLLDRLKLTAKTVQSMADGLRQVAAVGQAGTLSYFSLCRLPYLPYWLPESLPALPARRLPWPPALCF